MATEVKHAELWILLAVLIIVLYFIIVYPLIHHYGDASNEAAAIANLRTISSAEELYRFTHDRYGTFKELLGEEMLDEKLAEATSPRQAKAGYYYRLTLTKDGWYCVASPARPGKTGTRSFWINQTGEERWSKCESKDDPPAGPDSKKLGQ